MEVMEQQTNGQMARFLQRRSGTPSPLCNQAETVLCHLVQRVPRLDNSIFLALTIVIIILFESDCEQRRHGNGL